MSVNDMAEIMKSFYPQKFNPTKFNSWAVQGEKWNFAP